MRKFLSFCKSLSLKNFILPLFAAFLLAISLLGAILSDKTVSATERRHLSKFPSLTAEAVLKGSYTGDLEDYLLDHFPGRDLLRQAKTAFALHGLLERDVNGYYKVDGAIYEMDASLNNANITRAGTNFAQIMEDYFPNGKGYYAVIPDKNYFVAESHHYPHLDYDTLLREYSTAISSGATKDLTYIDLFSTLSIDHYYKTDLHWKQETLLPAKNLILSTMLGDTASDIQDHEEQRSQSDVSSVSTDASYQEVLQSDSFYGGYASASAISTVADSLIYLTNETIQDMTVYDYERQDTVSVYATNLLTPSAKASSQSLDPYDLYLWGARALLRIDNPALSSESGKRELVLFRDSFGSSIAPLLAEQYSTVYLVDLRYVSVKTAMQYISPDENCDVLFLYSTTLLNKSNSMRF